MRLLFPFVFTATLFAQPEIFILPPSGSLITPATQEPFTALSPINTRNVPAFFFQNAEGTKYYSVGRAPTDTVVVLDATNPTVVLARLNLSPATIAVLSPDRRRLLVGGSAGLHIIDTATDAVVATIPGPAPIDLAVSQDGRRAYVLTDRVTTIDLVTNAPVSVLPLAKVATALAINHTGLLYVSAQDRLYEISDVGSPTIRREFEVPGRPGRLIFTPDARTAVAINQTPASGFGILRFDLVLGSFSGGLPASGVRLDSIFLTELNRGFVFSEQTRGPLPFTVDPLAFGGAPPLASFSASFLTAAASGEFPRARNVYFSGGGQTVHYSNPVQSSISTRLISAGGLVVSAPPSFTGTPANLYAFNGDQTSGSLPLIVRVTDNVGRLLRDVRVEASNGNSAITNADGRAVFSPPGPFAPPITVTAGTAKGIFRLGAPSQAPASIAILAGQGQLGLVSFYPTPFRVVVRDAAGFPVVDTPVQFSLSPGAGQFDCQSARLCTVRTDANGQAELRFAPGIISAEEYSQQQLITVTAGNAPARTLFITSIASYLLPSLGRVAPVQNLLSGVVDTVLPDAIRINTIVLDIQRVGKSTPNVGLSIAAPLDFPDLACDGEAGVVLTDAVGVANCSLRLGSRPGIVDLAARLNIRGTWDDQATGLRVEIARVDVPTLRFVRGWEQTLVPGGSSGPLVVRATNRVGQPAVGQPVQWSISPQTGLVLQSAATATDIAGEAVAIVAAGSVPGKYTIKVIGDGLSTETSVFVRGVSFLVPPSDFTLTAEPGVVGVLVYPNPRESSWSVQGLPAWIRTPTPVVSGARTIWFAYDLNESLVSSRTARFTIAGTPVEFVQRAGLRPGAYALRVTASSGSIGTFDVSGAGVSYAYNVQNLLIRDSLDGRAACYLAYSFPLKKLYLVGDSGPEVLLPPIEIPSQQSVSNSQCTVLGIESYAATPELNPPPHVSRFRIAFAPSFGGSKIVYAALSDKFGRSAGWSIVGTHQVPPGPVTFPRPVSISPAAINTANVPISFTFEDQTDANNIETAWALVNDALDGRRACYIAYHRPSNQVYLRPDSGLAEAAFILPLGGSEQVSNSQCEISATGAVVTQTGSQLTVTLPIRFAPNWTFPRPKAIWTAVQTLTGQRSQWQALGVVQSPN